MMNKGLYADLWKVGLAVFSAFLLGLSVGYPLHSTLVATILVIAWQFHRLHRLRRWVKSPSNNPISDSSGQLYNLHGELSRQRRRAKQRKKQMATLYSQFRQAVSVLPDAIVLIDEIGRIRWANTNAEEMFGIRWPADSGLRFSNLVRNPKLETLLEDSKLKSSVAQIAANHASANSQTEPRTSAPTEAQQKETASPLIGVEISANNNSEQILNIKIIPYTDDLRMVLGRDVTRLMKVNQMHRDFVANVSHELKTPLTVIRGYLEILLGNKNLDERAVQALEQMSTQSERMRMIVQDLLFLSKLENEKRAFEVVEVTHLVNTIMEMIQPQVAAKAHKLELDIDYQLNLHGAQSELHTAFTNLILNAVTYTSRHGVIQVRWGLRDGYGEFRVSDNGPGIPAHHIPRLTERFYRADAHRSRAQGGTGLGLAIVKQVLQRHNASLEIDSIEGEGSTFICRFPPQHLMCEASRISKSFGR